MAKKIPDHIVDNGVRTKLATINEATDQLVKAHKELMRQLKSGTISEDGKKTLRDVIKAKNRLDTLWAALAPRLSDYLTRK